MSRAGKLLFRRMLVLLLAALPLVLTVSPDEAFARPPAPWCAHLSGDWGIDCSYHTFEQCREFISGVGGYCAANPRVILIEDRRYPRGRGARHRR